MKNYPLNEVDYYNNFKEAIFAIGNKYGEKRAITTYHSLKEVSNYSYQTLANDSLYLAEALAKNGYSKKHVAIISDNCYNYIILIFALTTIGSTVVAIDAEQSPESIKYMIEFADCELCFISENVKEVLSNDLLKMQIPIYSIENQELFDEFLSKGKKLLNSEDSYTNNYTPDKDDTAFILYTSGTTDKPKAVMLSHIGVLTNASDSLAIVKMPYKIFSSLPFYHIYGLNIGMINHLLAGNNLCINGNIKTMQRDLSLFKPNAIIAVPLICEMIYKTIVMTIKRNDQLSDKEKDNLVKLTQTGEFNNSSLVDIKDMIFPGLTRILSGGAHISESLAKSLMRCGIELIQGYGLTECSPLITGNRPNYYVLSSVGIPLPHYQVKIIDEEVCVKGISVMKGYYKNDEETKSAFIDGFFLTGDLGSFDSEGFLTIHGRKKNLIVLKNGKKISPEKLERKVLEIPFVKEVVAYGSSVGNNVDDVIPAITVYPDPLLTQGMSSFEILVLLQNEVDHINESLPSFEQIKNINISEKEFIKNTSKKILRNKVGY